MTQIPALDALAEQFDEAVRRQPSPRPTRSRAVVLVAVAAGIAAVAFTVGALSRPERVVAGAAPTLVDGQLAISYEQVLDDRAAVESQLASAGVNVTIREVPASPGMVGRVRWSSDEDPLDGVRTEQPTSLWILPSCDDPRVCTPWWPDDADRTQPPQGYEAGLLIPLDYDGGTAILVGREAEPDEPYALEGRPYSSGEVLSCVPLLGAPVAEVRPMVADAPVPIVWQLNDSLAPDAQAQVDPDGNSTIDDLDAAHDLVVEDAAYLTDHGVLLWVRRADPADWTEADHQAADRSLETLRNEYAAGC